MDDERLVGAEQFVGDGKRADGIITSALAKATKNAVHFRPRDHAAVWLMLTRGKSMSLPAGENGASERQSGGTGFRPGLP